MKIKRQRRGFTLIEMLVVTAIIALLASLLVPGLAGARRRATRAHCQNCMKQVATAIQLYTDDHDGWLPGPVDVGVSINYSSSSRNVLPYYIATYLGLPRPPGGYVRAQPLVCAGYQIESPGAYSDNLQARCYALNWTTNTSADAWLTYKAFGYPSKSMPVHRLIEVMNESAPQTVWAMQDVDQFVVEASSWDWYPNLPKTPTHHKQWNRLYFDWHVATVDHPDHATTGATYSP